MFEFKKELHDLQIKKQNYKDKLNDLKEKLI